MYYAMISIHDTPSLENLRRQQRIEPNYLRQLRNAFYKKRQTAAEALQQLPEPQRSPLVDAIAFHSLELHSRHDSQVDGASKLIFRTAHGHLLEAVILRIASGRTTLCVSSQFGCAARCEFCATGKMGMVEQLTRDEILDQIIQANRLLRAEGRSVRNVVFMGMGEPFHNEAEVYAALEVMLSPQCLAFSASHILISTVGIPEAMIRCAKRFPRLGMALSLHSARQQERERLIPLARRYPLPLLQAAMEEVAALQRRPLMIEYLLLDGLNDTDQDLMELTTYLRDLPVHINLIPYNSIDGAAGLRGTPSPRRHTFAAALTAAGFRVTIRYSLGADIAAACGQLVRRENDRQGNIITALDAPSRLRLR
jgi:23S rRNA (adenine2503-C2)-methyltransferase